MDQEYSRYVAHEIICLYGTAKKEIDRLNEEEDSPFKLISVRGGLYALMMSENSEKVLEKLKGLGARFGKEERMKNIRNLVDYISEKG